MGVVIERCCDPGDNESRLAGWADDGWAKRGVGEDGIRT